MNFILFLVLVLSVSVEKLHNKTSQHTHVLREYHQVWWCKAQCCREFCKTHMKSSTFRLLCRNILKCLNRLKQFGFFYITGSGHKSLNLSQRRILIKAVYLFIVAVVFVGSSPRSDIKKKYKKYFFSWSRRGLACSMSAY